MIIFGKPNICKSSSPEFWLFSILWVLMLLLPASCSVETGNLKQKKLPANPADYHNVFTEPAFRQMFSADHKFAQDFIKENLREFLIMADHDTLKTRMLLAVVYPELLRYSYFRDFFETKALKLAYVARGIDFADFSIGYFQIKPSFVERLEEELGADEQLPVAFDSIFIPDSFSGREKRKLRIERLCNKHWQWLYALAFYYMLEKNNPPEEFPSVHEAVAFYATAYNHNFAATKEEIIHWKDKKLFPYGVHYQNPFSYSEISQSFYTRKSNQLFINHKNL